MIYRGVTTPAPTPKKKRQDPLVGQLLAGKYKILKKIGEGGMGSVYIANQEPIDRKVAIKVLLGKLAEDEIAVKRFEQEAKAISKMQHPNTVTIYDFGRTETDDDEERLYIVMEYLKGRTLTQVLRGDGQLAPPRAARIIRQVCASLADAHQAGIIHRDLKPDNIFLTEVGEDKDWVKVLDFGVAKLADAEGAGTLTQTGMIFGTPKYMSPEQAEGRPIDYRADLYALGVVLYELLVGRPPFIADTPVGLLLKHISEPPPPFKKVRPDIEIDARMEAIVFKALEKVPDRRHQMVADLAADLESFERAATGSVQVAAGKAHSISSPGMPTEVVPGTLGGSAVTPADLQPPSRVPTDLSLGKEPATAAASAQHRPATAQHTAPASVYGHQMTTPGITAPVAHPGGIDTLGGGLSHEISGPMHPRPKGKAKLLIAGIGLLAGALALALFVAQQQKDQVVEARALTSADLEQPIEEVKRPPPATDPATPPPPVATPPPPPEFKRHNINRNAPPPPPPVQASRKVTITFQSSPTQAMVLLGGKQVGLTPFETQVAKDDDVLTFVFRKDGFKEQKRVVTASRDQELDITLEKAPDTPPPPPAKHRPRVPPPAQPPPPSEVDERVDELK